MNDAVALRRLRWAGIAGIVGALCWTLGDVLLIGAHAATADYPLVLGTYASRLRPEMAAMMLPSSESRLAAGALVADVGIVFYLAGSWHLFRGVLPAGPGWAWPVFALLVCGNAWSPLGHASFYHVGMVYKTLLVTPPAAHDALLALAGDFYRLVRIAWLLPIVTLGIGLTGLGLAIATGRTGWPRWFALVANPVSLVAIGMAIAAIVPEPVHIWLGGAAFNVGWLAIYVTSTILLWDGPRPRSAFLPQPLMKQG